MINLIPVLYLPGNRWFRIRELCGSDELSVCGAGTIDAISLLDRLRQDVAGIGNPLPGAAQLPVPDRHRLLTALYLNTYGEKVSSTVTCRHCGKPYDISFSLSEWKTGLTDGKNICRGDPENIYPFETVSGVKFRFPTGEDEISVAGVEPALAENLLMRKCLQENPENTDLLLLQETMGEIAPLADTGIDTECPECSAPQNFNFSIQHYLLSSLLKERKKLVAEIHQIAHSYGWGLAEILDLPRSMRLAFISMTGS